MSDDDPLHFAVSGDAHPLRPDPDLYEVIDDPKFWARLQWIMRESVERLPAGDRNQRIAYCVEHNQHGITMRLEDSGLLGCYWGGRRLCLVSASLFEEESYFDDLGPVLMPNSEGP